MNDLPADNKESFSAWLRQRAESAGYRFDGPRSGGLSRLAEDAGVTISVISRALTGERMPDLQTLRSLSGPLRTNLREMLIESGQATEVDLPATMTVGPVARLSAEQRNQAQQERDALEARLAAARAALAHSEAAFERAQETLAMLAARVAEERAEVHSYSADVERLRHLLDLAEQAVAANRGSSR
jgi:transcriptional regulator with XRE-family HTH domain